MRDSPDGKPTNHDNEIPIGVSTPLDGNSMDSNAFSNPTSNISQHLSNDKPRLADTPYPTHKLDNLEGKLYLMSVYIVCAIRNVGDGEG